MLHLLVQPPAEPERVEVDANPFVIGRAEDCHLQLPPEGDPRKPVSRWHCYLKENSRGWFVMDGSFQPVTETGSRKPSASGTFLNGERVAAETELKDGDVVEVGIWRFVVELRVETPVPPEERFEAFKTISDPERARTRVFENTDPELMKRFGQLHDLVHRLAHVPTIEDAFEQLLSYTVNKIQAAHVAAVIVDRGGVPDTRMAWHKDRGRLKEFRFSKTLYADLDPESSYLLEPKAASATESMRAEDISSGLLLPLWGKEGRLGVLYMDNRSTTSAFSEEDLYVASSIASLVSLQIALEKQTELSVIERNMARYFSPDVVNRIIEQSSAGMPIGLEVHERDVTVMFVDMEGFTALSRGYDPRKVSEMLNPYLETVARVIQREGGHVNKFIGDAVMAIFGANPGDQHTIAPAKWAEQAVRAALSLPPAWAKEISRRGLPPTRIRVGINSGRAVVGNIGYASRMEYSVIGDAVNQASRLEKLSPPNGAACSRATVELLKGRFDFDALGVHDIKGVGPTEVFQPRPKAG